MDFRITNPDLQNDELAFDNTLRPQRLTDFVGQPRLVENLHIALEAAKMRGEALDHVLLYGPPGLGKTTLANIIANEMRSEIKISSGPVLERAGDLAGILTNLTEKQVLFIDEIHRLGNIVEEYLYPAMEDFTLDLLIDKGPNARSLKIDLEPFTLVGATTRAGLLTSPLRARFGLILRLDFYSPQDLARIIRRSASILDVEIDAEGVHEIAMRSRGTPRIANRLLRRVRDFAQIRGDGTITQTSAKQALELLDVDRFGLDDMDKRILSSILTMYDGGPVGIKTLAMVVGEDPGTIEEVYEPYLVQEGFLKRTQRGREATRKTWEHLHMVPQTKAEESDLFSS